MEPSKPVLALIILIVCLGTLFGILLMGHNHQKVKVRSKRGFDIFGNLTDTVDIVSDTVSNIVDVVENPFESRNNSDVQDTEDLNEENISEFILNSVDTHLLDEYLKYLGQESDLAGTPMDLERAEWMKEKFDEFGFDKVSITPYEVLLSYPDKEFNNTVSIVDENLNVIETFEGVQPPLHSPEEEHPSVSSNFNAYSATGIVQGELVYVHYGRRSDYEEIERQNISLKGHIFLARYGKSFRGNIVKLAEEKGASGVLLYADSSDYTPEGSDNVYPLSGWLPLDGVQLGTLKEPLIGDPLTPHYPAIDGAFRISEDGVDGLPSIPVQPISDRHAKKLLQYMADLEADSNVIFPLSPGFKNESWTVRMDVKTSNQMATINNVIATIKGKEEPDRYVLVGNHRDTWLLGTVDAKSGSIAFLEAARVLGLLRRKKGWRPRRSIVFCSWGAEEYGLIGSVEWVQHFQRILEAKAVAYINVDVAVTGFPGDKFLRPASSPLIFEALYESALKVPNPNGTEVESGRTTLYDTWLYNFPKENSTKPKVQNLGTGTDHAAFFFHVGVTSADLGMNAKKRTYGYPLYHTLYETYHLVSNLLDPGFFYHKALTQIILVLTTKITEEKVIPFNVEDYAIFIKNSKKNILDIYEPQLEKKNMSINSPYWEKAVQSFLVTARHFQNIVIPSVKEETNPLAVRAVNDQLMMLERSFISPRGLTGKENMDHIVFIPSSSDAYASTTFSTLTDLLQDLDSIPVEEEEIRKSKIEEELARITYHINTATYVLRDPIQELFV